MAVVQKVSLFLGSAGAIRMEAVSTPVASPSDDVVDDFPASPSQFINGVYLSTDDDAFPTEDSDLSQADIRFMALKNVIALGRNFHDRPISIQDIEPREVFQPTVQGALQSLEREDGADVKMKPKEAADSEGDAEDNLCAICYDTFDESDSKVLSCGHAFHIGCINKWHERVENCPVCRRDNWGDVVEMPDAQEAEATANNAYQNARDAQRDAESMPDFSPMKRPALDRAKRLHLQAAHALKAAAEAYLQACIVESSGRQAHFDKAGALFGQAANEYSNGGNSFAARNARDWVKEWDFVARLERQSGSAVVNDLLQ